MFLKSEKHPSPPFTRNYLTHKTLNKKVKGEGLKTLFYIYARVKEKSIFSSCWFFGFSKNPIKKYNIRFKIYPSPFTSSPQPSFHIFVIGLPAFVFWVYPSEIFCYLSEIISYPSEIFFWMIPWYFSHFISRIHANRTNRIGRKRKRRIFAFEIKRIAYETGRRKRR